jgi:hypothetical protein
MIEALVSIDPTNKVQHETQMQGSGYEGYKLTLYVSKKNPKDTVANAIGGVPMHFPTFIIEPYHDSVKGFMMSIAVRESRYWRLWCWANPQPPSPTS